MIEGCYQKWDRLPSATSKLYLFRGESQLFAVFTADYYSTFGTKTRQPSTSQLPISVVSD